MEKIVNGKVKRLHSACCGMENGKVYEANIGESYVLVKLPNGKWTADHWISYGSNPFFEIIEKDDE